MQIILLFKELSSSELSHFEPVIRIPHHCFSFVNDKQSSFKLHFFFFFYQIQSFDLPFKLHSRSIERCTSREYRLAWHDVLFHSTSGFRTLIDWFLVHILRYLSFKSWFLEFQSISIIYWNKWHLLTSFECPPLIQLLSRYLDMRIIPWSRWEVSLARKRHIELWTISIHFESFPLLPL